MFLSTQTVWKQRKLPKTLILSWFFLSRPSKACNPRWKPISRVKTYFTAEGPTAVLTSPCNPEEGNLGGGTAIQCRVTLDLVNNDSSVVWHVNKSRFLIQNLIMTHGCRNFWLSQTYIDSALKIIMRVSLHNQKSVYDQIGCISRRLNMCMSIPVAAAALYGLHLVMLLLCHFNTGLQAKRNKMMLSIKDHFPILSWVAGNGWKHRRDPDRPWRSVTWASAKSRVQRSHFRSFSQVKHQVGEKP